MFGLKVKTSPSEKAAKTIGIAGCMPRIGATTQAIQIIKYLQLMGYKACYLEINKNEYIDNVKNCYDEINIKDENITIENVDMFQRSQLSSVNKIGYDYCIKDYGSITEQSFEETSFLEQDLRILICGSKPNEISESQVGIQMYQDAYYIFNFVSKREREGIIEAMSCLGGRTSFPDYVPDPFTYLSSANGMYKQLLNI